jgi:hypothetical protein
LLGRSAIVADEREGERSVFGIENSVPNRHLATNFNLCGLFSLLNKTRI